MSEYFSMGLCALVGFAIAMAISQWTGLSDALNDALTQPGPVTKQQQLEDLCISGNANACKMYEVRYQQRCIL